MAKYLFVYHGGGHPTNEAEVKKVMDAWGAWFGSMGAAVIDGGNPTGPSSSVNAKKRRRHEGEQVIRPGEPPP